MFEAELYEEIKTNFTLAPCYFGEADTKQKNPYIVQYSLDTDGTRAVLCNIDDFTDGDCLIQWNIYCSDAKYAFKLKHELMKFIANIKLLTNYRVLLNNHESSPSGTDLNTGLFTEIVSRSFTYTKYEGV